MSTGSSDLSNWFGFIIIRLLNPRTDPVLFLGVKSIFTFDKIDTVELLLLDGGTFFLYM